MHEMLIIGAVADVVTALCAVFVTVLIIKDL